MAELHAPPHSLCVEREVVQAVCVCVFVCLCVCVCIQGQWQMEHGSRGRVGGRILSYRPQCPIPHRMYTPCKIPRTVDTMDFTPVIRLCYMVQLTAR